MREILFRGQTRRKGEKVRMDGTPVESNWVYGGVLQGTGDHSIIYQTEPDIEKKVVYTDTIGQFTGLTDKNGTKIFEGDIVEYTTKLSRNTEEIVNVYEIKYSKEQARFIAFLPNGVFDPVAMRYGKVIGNIYDNPELIGGEEDENSN